MLSKISKTLLLFVVLVAAVAGGCKDDDKGPEVTYTMSTSNAGDLDADMSVKVTYDDDTYTTGTVVVTGHSQDIAPMPTGFGGSEVNPVNNIFAGAEFETVNTSATAISLTWTDGDANAKVSQTTTYTYTFTAAQ
ncbi:hypothetical protein [Algivirga pacifica]|uniref:Uncharacterized protein n=1 Tax=Algivirga pacifica TaxID=1162670 RepID=A0ABP9DNK1_9BACT